MLKYKIMYLYSHNIMVLVFKIEDLKRFLKELGLISQNSYENMQNIIMEYFKTTKFTETVEFMYYLYKKYPPKIDKDLLNAYYLDSKVSMQSTISNKSIKNYCYGPKK